MTKQEILIGIDKLMEKGNRWIMMSNSCMKQAEKYYQQAADLSDKLNEPKKGNFEVIEGGKHD